MKSKVGKEKKLGYALRTIMTIITTRKMFHLYYMKPSYLQHYASYVTEWAETWF